MVKRKRIQWDFWPIAKPTFSIKKRTIRTNFKKDQSYQTDTITPPTQENVETNTEIDFGKLTSRSI